MALIDRRLKLVGQCCGVTTDIDEFLLWDVALRSRPDAVWPIQEVLAIAERRFGILVDSNNDCLDVMVAPGVIADIAPDWRRHSETAAYFTCSFWTIRWIAIRTADGRNRSSASPYLRWVHRVALTERVTCHRCCRLPRRHAYQGLRSFAGSNSRFANAQPVSAARALRTRASEQPAVGQRVGPVGRAGLPSWK